MACGITTQTITQVQTTRALLSLTTLQVYTKPLGELYYLCTSLTRLYRLTFHNITDPLQGGTLSSIVTCYVDTIGNITSLLPTEKLTVNGIRARRYFFQQNGEYHTHVNSSLDNVGITDDGKYLHIVEDYAHSNKVSSSTPLQQSIVSYC